MLFQEFDEQLVLNSLSFESQIRSLIPSLAPQNQNNERSLLSLPMKEIYNDSLTIEIKSTTQDNILENNTNKEYTKFIRRKRKDPSIKNKKCHSKLDKDNILRTIQVHFFSFIIKFINEILLHSGFEDKFYSISYKCKKDIKKSHFDKLKNRTIGSIISQKISKKYKKDENTNIKLITFKNNIIKNFLSKQYINVFNNIYYQNKKEIKIDDKIIYLSKVKTFEDFINNEKYDNNYRERIKQAIESNYLSPKIKFTTQTIF